MSKTTEVEEPTLEQIRHKGAVDVDVVRMFVTLDTHVWVDEGDDISSARFARRLATVCEQEFVAVPDGVLKCAVVRFEQTEFESVEDAIIAFINCYTDFHFGPEDEPVVPQWLKRLVTVLAFFVQALTLFELLMRLLGMRKL